MKKLASSFLIVCVALSIPSYAQQMKEVCLDGLCLGTELHNINLQFTKQQPDPNLPLFAEAVRQKLLKQTKGLDTGDINVFVRHSLPSSELSFALDNETVEILKKKRPIFCEFSFFVGAFNSRSGYPTRATFGTTGKHKIEILKLERWFEGLNKVEQDSLEDELRKRYAKFRDEVDVGYDNGLTITLVNSKLRNEGEMDFAKSLTGSLSKEAGCRKSVAVD
jgi:hypothetical protein